MDTGFLLKNDMHNYNLKYIAKTSVEQYIDSEEQKSHFYEFPLGCIHIENGTVLPGKDWTENGLLYGGICDLKLNFIDQSGFREKGSLPYSYEEDKVCYKDEEVVFIGFFQNCYGHGITDHIKKLWFLRTAEYENLLSENNNLKIIYIVEKNAPLPSWQKEIFSLAGFDCSNWEQITEITRYKIIHIPFNSLVNDEEYRMFTPQFRSTIDLIKSKVAKRVERPIKKVYFTRTGIDNKWRECGEERVERVFRKKGFTIIHPERLSVAEQISLLMECDEFASTEGSCAHNSIFCKPQTKVIILRKADYANSYQIMINEFASLDVVYIDAHHSSKADVMQPWHGPFYMYVSPYLRKYFKLSKGLPFWSDPLYWIYKTRKWNLYFKINKIFKR